MSKTTKKKEDKTLEWMPIYKGKFNELPPKRKESK